MYRKMGIHTLNEAQEYDVEKRRRVKYAIF